MRLQTRLLYVVAGAILPLLALSLGLSWLLVSQQVDTFRQGALDRNRAFMSAVDAELRGHMTTLDAVAAIFTDDDPALARFRAEAESILRSQPDWQEIRLARPDGEIILSAASIGVKPAGVADGESFRKALESRRNVVGGVAYRPALGKYGIAVRHPVVRNGSVAYVLSAIIDPGAFARLLRAQDLPENWVSGLVDSTGHFVARVPARSNADMASRDFLAALRGGPEGWYRGLTKEGIDTFTAYRISGFSGWAIGLAVPTALIYGPARRAAWTLGLGTLITLAIAVALTLWMSRRIVHPIATLARGARALGRAGIVEHPDPARITEIADLSLAMREAQAAISERAELVEREQAALKVADRAKDEFLAMLGHELRNPLAAITSATHVMTNTPRGGAMSERAMAVVSRQAGHMTRLIEDLLEISRLRLGKVSLRLEAIDLGQLVERVIQVWEESGRIAPDRIKLQVVSVTVAADRARVEQVLSNLLDNAIKFSEPAAPIEVRVANPGGEALLSVTDHGSGFPPERGHHLFDLFVQEPQGPDRARGGLGLGLALVKRLTELHGGTVRGLSEGPGRGATFEVRLPVAPVSHAATVVPHAAPVEAPRRILVVDDNRDGADMMAAMLGMNGNEVRTAYDAASGFEIAVDWRPDIGLLDIGLPHVSGHELAARLRADPRTQGMRLIAVSGYGQSADQERSLAAGFQRHVTKPVDAELLEEIIAEVARASPAAG